MKFHYSSFLFAVAIMVFPVCSAVELRGSENHNSSNNNVIANDAGHQHRRATPGTVEISGYNLALRTSSALGQFSEAAEDVEDTLKRLKQSSDVVMTYYTNRCKLEKLAAMTKNHITDLNAIIERSRPIIKNMGAAGKVIEAWEKTGADFANKVLNQLAGDVKLGASCRDGAHDDAPKYNEHTSGKRAESFDDLRKKLEKYEGYAGDAKDYSAEKKEQLDTLIEFSSSNRHCIDPQLKLITANFNLLIPSIGIYRDAQLNVPTLEINMPDLDVLEQIELIFGNAVSWIDTTLPRFHLGPEYDTNPTCSLQIDDFSGHLELLNINFSTAKAFYPIEFSGDGSFDLDEIAQAIADECSDAVTAFAERTDCCAAATINKFGSMRENKETCDYHGNCDGSMDCVAVSSSLGKRCTDGRNNSYCDIHSRCDSKICYAGSGTSYCTNGGYGSPCSTGLQCANGYYCNRGACYDGRPGSRCSIHLDCDNRCPPSTKTCN